MDFGTSVHLGVEGSDPAGEIDMHRRFWSSKVTLALALSACGLGDRGEGDLGGGGVGPGSDDGGGGTGGEGGQDDGGGDGGAGGDDGGGDDGDGGDDDSRFDVGFGGDLAGGAGDDEGVACEKVDFLFVVDNSGSMEDEQQNLITSFPGFIDTIQQTLNAQDYHVMAVDTDEVLAAGGNSMTCSPAPQCCDSFCATYPDGTCNNEPCTPANDSCDWVLGAGRNDDMAGEPCEIEGGNRYMVDGQPDLGATFDCAARVGIHGDGNERAMEAVGEALGTLSQPGQCNEGFVRDDAILVITIITDEEDDPFDPDTGAGPDSNSPGDPASWMQTVVNIKNGDESAVVVLSLVGDTDLPGAICQPLTGTAGAEPAPRLRQFAEMFTYGQWCSVCAPDYGPCFEEAVSVIDTACDEFVPPG